jgi:nitrogen fixation/metabolism regulation signal transduction histidine kinase
MFKSIQYKLTLFIGFLIVSVAATTCLIIFRYYTYAFLSGILILICLNALQLYYRKFNSNIIFLLNALENGDYSFHFSETKLSIREKEFNIMLNRIREILANARKEVIENEKFLSLIIESVSTGIFIMDDRGIIQTVNQSALQLFGLPVFTHINQLSNVNETFPALFRNLKSGDSPQIPVINEREELQISLRVSEIILKRGPMKVITLHNIGNELESKEMESWIRLIRVMTHEIMNSIAPITSLSETLLFLLKSDNVIEQENIGKNTVEAFETINTTAKGLLSFVESYREFTGIPKPEFSVFDLSLLLEKIIRLQKNIIKEKNIHVRISLASGNFEVNADEKLIRQVLVNLMKNAAEATDNNGEITVSLGYRNDGRATVNICNTGELIPKDILPHIFIPFFTTKESGSGIGLSVSRYIMRLHGGKLLHSVSPDNRTVFSMVF